MAKQRSTSIRYNQAAGQAAQHGTTEGYEEPVWTDDEILEIEARAYKYIKMMHDLGHSPRYWESVNVGDELTDGAYVGPSRGHLFPRWARFIGMPRGYGYGASMGAWITDYLAG